MGEQVSANVMTADFVLLGEDEAKNADSVGRALSGGKVVVVNGPEQPARGVIDALGPSDGRAVHVTVEPDHRMHEVLRAMQDAGARVAVVTGRSATTGQMEVLGVITERDVVRAGFPLARLAD